jgi:hypothetical protein
MLRSRKTFLKKQQLHLKNERYAHEWTLLEGIKWK